ncbi:unnamed protein product [Dibothriocephalus latus]|uniref:FERM domain-containing protein n=1 Tax=Dibothriocephalus latus TaxID=60516 RepID=A0A3P7LI03_DIBLA|nr:unnamed protein product [Dibothriocephalus latus]
MSLHDWETRISRWHLKLHDVSFLDSIVEYLDIAQDVELYGASIFEVESKSGSRKWISLDAVGLNIYESKRDVLTDAQAEIAALNNALYESPKDKHEKKCATAEVPELQRYNNFRATNVCKQGPRTNQLLFWIGHRFDWLVTRRLTAT